MKVMMRDPDLPHQIVVLAQQSSSKITVSCNCLATRHRNGAVTHKPIGSRVLWEPGEAAAVWRGHMADIGEVAAS